MSAEAHLVKPDEIEHFIDLAEMGVAKMKQNSKRDLEKESHWRKLIEEWKASKLSGAGFCRQANLKESTFYSWSKLRHLAAITASMRAGVCMKLRVRRMREGSFLTHCEQMEKLAEKRSL